MKFAAQSERFNTEQKSLLEETLDADLQGVSEEIERLAPATAAPREREQPKRNRCRLTCRAAKCAASPRTPPAAAAAR